MRRLPLWILVLVLAGCGRAAPEDDTASDAWLDGIPGTYAMDARRTLGKTIPGPDGKPMELTDEKIKELEAGQGVGAMSLVLKKDNTFEIISGTGESAFRTGGTWKEAPTGFSMVTKTVNGEPAPPEVQVVENYEVERGYVIGVQGTTRIYLKKQKPVEQAE